VVYRTPPVIEAVIGTQISPRLSQRDVERVRDRLKKRYPSIQVNNSMRIDVAASGVASVSLDATGYVLRSADAARFAIIQKDGWSAGLSAPYPGWNDLKKEFIEAFGIIHRIIESRPITRIGCRYTNRIDIPSEIFTKHTMNELFSISANTPNNQDYAYTGTAMNTQFKHLPTGASVIINFGNLLPLLIGFDSVNLDIDVSFNNMNEINKNNVLERVEVLRGVQNSVFEQSISGIVRGLIR